MPQANGEPTAEETAKVDRELEDARRAKREIAIRRHVEDCLMVASAVREKYNTGISNDMVSMISAAIVSLAISDLETSLCASLRGI